MIDNHSVSKKREKYIEYSFIFIFPIIKIYIYILALLTAYFMQSSKLIHILKFILASRV